MAPVWLKEPGRKTRHVYENIDAMVSYCGVEGKDTSLFDATVPKCQRCVVIESMRKRKKARGLR
jgi:hypothetical protein